MQKIYRNLIIAGAIIAVIVIGVVLYFVFGTDSPQKLSPVEVKTGDITEKINLTGQVKASEEVDLSFEGSGKLVANYVKAGDNVYAGQTLAVLDQGAQEAALTSAQGALAQAQANYQKLLDGATAEDVKTSQDAVNSAKQNLANAYTGSINILNNAYTDMYNAYNVTVTIQNNYFSSQDPSGIAVSEAKNDISANMQSAKTSIAAAQQSMEPTDIDAAIIKTASSLNNIYDDLNTIRSQCDQGIYFYKVTASDKASLDAQKTYINGDLSGSTALTGGVTTLQQNLASLKLVVQTAQDQLSVTTAAPTQAEIDLAKAQITSAQGQVDAAQTALDNTVLSAPFSGKVDKDNADLGEIVSPSVPIATISNSNLEINTDIPEIDMADAKIGDNADVTLDAFGGDVHFPATIISIDSAPSIVGGVSVYEAKLKFNNLDSRIEPGMTANINIISDTHKNVLIIPISAVIQQNGEYFVILDEGNSQKESKEVNVGIRDDKNIEIISGLSLGEKVLAY